jgi:hypothetical protein
VPDELSDLLVVARLDGALQRIGSASDFGIVTVGGGFAESLQHGFADYLQMLGGSLAAGKLIAAQLTDEAFDVSCVRRSGRCDSAEGEAKESRQ